MANADIQAKTTEDVYHRLRSIILRNEIPVGKKINQKELAQTLGTSRTPVIKALHMLEAEGVVDNIPNKGFYIHRITLNELVELFMLRQSLEMISASNISERGTPEQMDQLEAVFAPFVGQEEIDRDSYFQADRQFHMMMIEFCDNSLLRRINESLRIMERTFCFGLLRSPKETLAEHLAIVNAMRQRDPFLAQTVTRTHTETTKQYLQLLGRQIRALGIDPTQLSINEVMEKASYPACAFPAEEGRMAR